MSNKRPFSVSLKVDNLVFISGQIGIDPDIAKLSNATFETEIRQVMSNIQAQLTSYGLTLNDLVSTIIYLKDMANYIILNKVYGSYFKEKFPTRTCIAVLDLPANAAVEISGIAHFSS